MQTALQHGAALAAGLAITLVLASRFTPRAWWRRPTARNLFIVCAGTWALGAAIGQLAGAGPSQAAQPALAGLPAPFAAARAAAPARAPNGIAASDSPRAFRVHRDLNLRAAARVDAPLLATVPAGATVTATGLRSGDWWQVQAPGGKQGPGWVSSLWLRNVDE